MTHVTCRLTAKNRDQLWNPTLGSRVYGLPLPFLPRPSACQQNGIIHVSGLKFKTLVSAKDQVTHCISTKRALYATLLLRNFPAVRHINVTSVNRCISSVWRPAPLARATRIRIVLTHRTIEIYETSHYPRNQLSGTLRQVRQPPRTDGADPEQRTTLAVAVGVATGNHESPNNAPRQHGSVIGLYPLYVR